MTLHPSSGHNLRPSIGARRVSRLLVLTRLYHESPIYAVYQRVRLHRPIPFLLLPDSMSFADGHRTPSRSSPGNQSSPKRNVEQQTYLQQQRLNTYMSESWENGNRLVALPYRSVSAEASSASTEASRFSQGLSLVGQPQDLRGVGSWAASQGGK